MEFMAYSSGGQHPSRRNASVLRGQHHGADNCATRSAAASQSSMLAPSVDTMLRGVTGKSGNGQPLDSETRADITRTIASAVAAGQLSAGDRTYLAQVVAQRTGIAQPEAEKRVDDAFASALKAIDTARKAAVATGLGTVTALLFGMAAAWYAAQREDASR